MSSDAIDTLWASLETEIRGLAPSALRELRLPATDADVAWFAELGVPADWQALYRVHDGQGMVFPAFFWMRLRGPTDTVEAEHTRMCRAGGPGLVAGDPPARVVGPVQRAWASERWIPIGTDFGGELLCIDLDPASGGQVGQLIRIGDSGVEVLAPSASAWLEQLVDGIRVGEWQPVVRPEETTRMQCSVGRLLHWAIGEARQPPPLSEHDLSLVRLDPAFAGDGLDRDPSRVLVFCVDGELSDEVRPVLTEVRILGPTGGELAEVVNTSREACHEVAVAAGIPSDSQLMVTISIVSQPARDSDTSSGPRLLRNGRYVAAAAAWDATDSDPEHARCLGALGRRTEALSNLDDCAAPHPVHTELWLATGQGEAASAHLPELGTVLAARVLGAVDRTDEALAQLDAAHDPTRPDVRWWRAALLESVGEREAAAAELEAAAADGFAMSHHDQRVAWLRAAALRQHRGDGHRHGRLEVALTDEVMAVRDVVLDSGLVTARVELTPDEAARGRTVDLILPTGPLAVSLPPGAGHGAQLTLRDQGNAGHTVHVEVLIHLPDEWRADPDARPASLSFAKWTVHARVPTTKSERRDGLEMRLATHRELVAVSCPPGASPGDTVTVEGAGLSGPRDRRGDLIVQWIDG